MPSDLQQLDPNLASHDPDDDLLWYDIRDLGVEGRGWNDTAAFYDRLPARAEGRVPAAVWELSRCSAGMQVRFTTDASAIAARWALRYPKLALPHMPASGVSGLDLYAQHEGRWRFAGAAWPEDATRNRGVLADQMTPAPRHFRLHLPLYNGVERVEIGLPRGAALRLPPAYPDGDARPIVCYGTSIVQGGCASRPGMAYPAILSRRLGRPTLNLGFSGNGKAEVVMAELLGELDASAYLIDPLPNLYPEQVAERIEPFVTALRRVRPVTPIVLVESITYQAALFRSDQHQRHTASNEALRAAYRRLLDAGVTGLRCFAGDRLLGDDGDATVDSTHPTDLGFVRMAEALAEFLMADC